MTAPERPAMHLVGFGVIAAAVCCGTPLLLAAGSAVSIAGFGLRSWSVVLAGLAAAVFGAWEHRRRNGNREDPPVDATTNRRKI